MLERGFAQPPDSTKPWCYWYWITDNISREGITKDLEAMKRVGISQAFIGNIYLDEVKHGTVKALTEEWWGMVEHAIRAPTRNRAETEVLTACRHGIEMAVGSRRAKSPFVIMEVTP